MICPACGTENKDGVIFCKECGKALTDEPIELDLEQINLPAASRKAHIVKVSAAKKNEDAAPEINTEDAQSAGEEDYIPFGEAPQAAPEQEAEASEAPAAPALDPTAAPMKMRNWLPVFLLCMVPGVNFIMLLVWAFSKKSNQSKKSFARLLLIFFAVLLVLSIAGLVVYAAFFNKDLLTKFM